MVQKIRVLTSLAEVSAADWDAVANPADQQFNPFVSHAFLSALGESGSATVQTGWAANHLLLEEGGKVLGAVPCYLKSHSQGEYVFDHGWAEAFHRAGGRYYPKLQVAVPFSPVPGPRLLAASEIDRFTLLSGLVAHVKNTRTSSAHITFMPEANWAAAPEQWLRRQDIQFHWQNNGYKTFEEFLAALSSNKRKNIRKERRIVADQGITFQHVTGSDLTEKHWDHFFAFYVDTGSRKWGRPYLTRKFFSLLGERMREHVLLVLAMRNGKIIAGALNMIGGNRLYGRNWGCAEDHPFLHFETCYYQAIDFAIARGLKVVEAGAQGEHKLARGYVPVKTHSLHYLAHPGLARAVSEYLEQERAAVDEQSQLLAEHAPFRQDNQEQD
jgi:uncharacterized protein